MFILVKVIMYLIAAHVFYNQGITLDSHIFDFVVSMSCLLLIDICSYFMARNNTIKEILFEEEEEDH